MTASDKKIVGRQWTKEEDDLMYKLLSEATDLSFVPILHEWKRIQPAMHWRTVDQMRSRWRRIQHRYPREPPPIDKRPEKPLKAPRTKRAKAPPPVAKDASFLALDDYVLWREPTVVEIGDPSWLDPLLEFCPRV